MFNESFKYIQLLRINTTCNWNTTFLKLDVYELYTVKLCTVTCPILNI
jgi:hypothetical protein